MKTTHPRLMILGGGSSQMTLLARAGAAGFTTILADRDDGAPGRALAAEFVRASTFDADAITDAARRLRVDAIATAGTDQPVLTAAIASARLDLPFPVSVETARAVTNKRVMKARFEEAGVPTAPHRFIHADDDCAEVARALLEVAAPYVVKPVDSQGQRGVGRAESAAEVTRLVPEALRHSRERVVLVESYYPSTEITVSGWVCCGRTHIFSVTDRVTIERPPTIGVCVAHRHPSVVASRVATEVVPLVEAVVAACGIESGPIYFQFLVGSRGIIVNEAACRLGGAYEDEVLPVALGHDIVDYLLRSVREPGSECPAIVATVERRRRDGPAGDAPFCVPLVFAQPGQVVSLRGAAEARRLPGVHAMRFLLSRGVEIVPMRNSTQRIAYAVITGHSVSAVNDTVAQLFRTIGITGTDGRELLMDTATDCMIP